MTNDNEDNFSQYSLEYANSTASTEAPLSEEEKKIAHLIELISRYIYLGSDDYEQKTEDLQNIKTILLQNVDLLNSEASIEFITTKLCDQFANQPGFKFNRKVIMSSVKYLFEIEEIDIEMSFFEIEEIDIEMSLSFLFEDFRTISKPEPAQKTPLFFPPSVPNGNDSPNQCCLFPKLFESFLGKSIPKEETFFI